MDNPFASSSGFFHRMKLHSRSSTDILSEPITKDTEDESSATDTSTTQSKHSAGKIRSHVHHGNYFSRHMKMTPLESSSKPKISSMASTEKAGHANAVKMSYLRECERWYTTRKMNSHARSTDPLTFSATRLDAFLQLYNSLLSGTLEKSPITDEKLDLIGGWSCQALKYLTGIQNTITMDILADFSNNESKSVERLKTVYLMGDYFTTQWSWQLAIDNPDTEFYCYTLGPVLFTAISEYRTNIGPSNYHVIRGESLSNLPFSKNTFACAVCYDLWLHVKDEEWDPVLSEILRLLAPHGQVSLFLMDFTILNCQNEVYNNFFEMIQDILRREGIDPFPCKRIQARLLSSGFATSKYSFISLKKGRHDNLGSMMEMIQSFFEYLIFTKIAQLSLSDEELAKFKEMRIKYNTDLRNGELLEDFGDAYFMFLKSGKAG